MFDILILSAEKDFNKIKFVYESINKNVENFNKIYCITNVNVIDSLKISNIGYYNDNDVVDFDFSKFKGNVLRRKGWYVQQYIKLFQNVTSCDYLVVDSDIFFNRKINIYDNNKPSFFFGRDQYHLPYFNFMKMMLDLDKVYNYSFINEIMYFKKEYIQKMLDLLGIDIKGFFDLSVEILNKINHDAGMSEYELYGNFVTKYFPDSYQYKKIKTYLGGKHEKWNDFEIANYMKMFENQDFDIVSMHTWV